ncbi:hypothetical protein A3SI_15488 [Nitritalea halalkaliphila LW7]|uniref:Uncharacterized protein n=1 Tax=Nitritalea halalkaliphila LW7 TaxID=1189621 RepID=I5BYE3_9BACT|nr:hypothetical protein [Nitritalea halalkaliphila]EIM74595.1 hypothetical protein A3SI_15488 [Nitritalea halalkaliphila LW7]
MQLILHADEASKAIAERIVQTLREDLSVHLTCTFRIVCFPHSLFGSGKTCSMRGESASMATQTSVTRVL